MVRDLKLQGRSSRYLVALTGFPIYELKPKSRGGENGGTRVYLFLTEHDEAGLVTCEVKDGDEPDAAKLKLNGTGCGGAQAGRPGPAEAEIVDAEDERGSPEGLWPGQSTG
jgi:hypothetical protein